jgi:hypothetical protein
VSIDGIYCDIVSIDETYCDIVSIDGIYYDIVSFDGTYYDIVLSGVNIWLLILEHFLIKKKTFIRNSCGI